MKVAALCTLSTGLVAIHRALEMDIEIVKVVGLSPNVIDRAHAISGYVDIKGFCDEHGLDFDYVNQYSLKDENPNELFKDVDLLWVAGWQRLIPERFIDCVKFGAIGAHGSCDGITLGRGRSPQNWALLIGSKSFEISVFRIAKGVDNGAVVASDKFELTQMDNILTSYFKVAMSVSKIVSRIVKNPSLLDNASPQSEYAEYFPKRTPEDGGIDWGMSVKDIYNQVRSLADPYPNARTFYDEIEVLIKRSRPIPSEVNSKPGSIVYKYPTGELLVAGIDGYLLIEKYEATDSPVELKQGEFFQSVEMQSVVDEILYRFEKEFPKKKLNSSLVGFWLNAGLRIDH